MSSNVGLDRASGRVDAEGRAAGEWNVGYPAWPNFSDDTARVAWERAYPSLVCDYYATLRRLAVGGLAGDYGVAGGAAPHDHVGCRSCADGAGVHRTGQVGTDVPHGHADIGVGGAVGGGAGACGGTGEREGGGANVGDELPSVAEPVVRGKNYDKNRAKRERRKRLASAWRTKDSGVCVSDGSDACAGSLGSARTVDTRTAVEIEAAQTLAERRVAENRLAVAQANAKTASFADKAKTEAWERLSGARMSQRINQANAAAHKAYNAQDKSLQSVDSAGSAGEFALRQMVKEARNSQFVNAYVQKQNELLVRHADSHVLEAIKRIPKPKLDNMFDVLEEQYERMGPEQRAQLDVDANVANAKWDEKLYMGEGVLDDPLPPTGQFSPALQEMMRKVKLQGEMIASGYEAQRVAAEKIKV